MDSESDMDIEGDSNTPGDDPDPLPGKTDQRKRDAQRLLEQYPDFLLGPNGFICRICSAFASPADRSTKKFHAFISSGSNLRDHPTERLTDHLKSKLHARCCENEKAVKEMLSRGGLSGMFDKHVQSTIEINRQYFAQLIKSLHYHVHHYIPKSQISDFVPFLADLGEEVCKTFLEKNSLSKYGRYLSPKSVEELLTSYSIYCSRKVRESLQNAEVCTYYSDDSEAHNDSDEMISFISWVDPKEVLGTMQPYCFLDSRSVAPPPSNADKQAAQPVEGATSLYCAKALYSTMKKALAEFGVEQELIKFICFDGTNTMSGETKGVQKLWRQDQPATIYVNCRNHRLALVFVHLKKNVSCD